MEDSNKVIRILDLYNKLIDGELLNKHYEARYYKVSEKSIQRDIDDIRKYLEQRMVNADGIHRAIVYDRLNKGYRLEKAYDNRLTNSEVLALCKILLDRLPTAEILKEEDGVYTISAEVFGKGIDMWLRSQGDAVKVLKK